MQAERRVLTHQGIAHTLAHEGALEAAFAAALAADRFTVIAAEIPRRAYDGLI